VFVSTKGERRELFRHFSHQSQRPPTPVPYIRVDTPLRQCPTSELTPPYTSALQVGLPTYIYTQCTHVNAYYRKVPKGAQNTIINLIFRNGFFCFLNSRFCTSESIILIAVLTDFDDFLTIFGDFVRFYLFALSEIIILIPVLTFRDTF
jgi:hypothetical protein